MKKGISDKEFYVNSSSANDTTGTEYTILCSRHSIS